MNKMMLKKQYMLYALKKKGSRLPSEFQEVEYIESTGTQYIDTGLTPNGNYSFDIKINASTNRKSILGALEGWEKNAISLYINDYNNLLWSFANKSKQATHNSFPLNTDIQITSNRGTLRAGNEVVILDNSSFNYIGRNIILFGTNGPLGPVEFALMKLYYCKWYDGNTLIRDFIPCYRKSDNEVGLYDIVNKQFYTNQGTGSFLCGRPLVYDTIAGYVQVDYIELKREDRTYGSYLDIDDYIVNTSQYKTEIKFIEPSDATKYNCFGFANNGSSIVSQLGVFTSSGTRYIAFQHKTSDTLDNITFDTNWHTYYCENGGQYFDGVKKFSNSINYTTETNINKWYLFSRAVNGDVWNNGFCYIQCKYFFTYRNNKFKRILIPMRRLVDGEIGMYDLNKEVFYTDEYGTHSFTSGEVLTA